MSHLLRKFRAAPGAVALALAALLMPAFPGRAGAHDFGVTPVEIRGGAEEVQVVVHLSDLEILQFILADPAGRLRFDSIEEIRAARPKVVDYVTRRVKVEASGAEIVSSPPGDWPAADFRFERAAVDSAGIPLALVYRLPKEAAAGREGRVRVKLTLFAEGDFSPLYRVRVLARDGSVERDVIARPFETIIVPLAPGNAGPAASAYISAYTTILRFLRLGFLHIVPLGLDHILFVLGLYLLAPKFKVLLKQVTAFTVAHSLTLGLSIFGVVSLPARIVEPLIALSIVFIAVENIFAREMKPWRWAVVFMFGLVHGLGFAGVLTELGLPRAQAIPALLSFNLGVEAAQLAVIGLSFLVTLPVQRRSWYGKFVAIPASLVIAITGALWTVQRVIR